MPWATIGAFGWHARNSFHTDGCVPGNSAFSTMRERNIQFLEQPADARDAPVDGVLTERLVHEVRIAGHHVRAEDRALAEAELLDEQGEADRDLLAAGPGGDMDRLAREAGDAVDCAPAPRSPTGR